MTSVSVLRQQQLKLARRPFLARGSRVQRCTDCLLPHAHCICAHIPQVPCRSAFLLLMYHGEVFKPSNTGRLIADLVADSHAFQWTRTDFEPALLALLQQPHYAPIVVFPHEYAEAEHCISSPLQLPEVATGAKTPLFIMLDGTWREAKKMFKSPYLQGLPVLGIHPEQGSNYQLREAAHLHQLCTVEVGIEVLKLNQDMAASQALAQYFARFREHYLQARANLPAQ